MSVSPILRRTLISGLVAGTLTLGLASTPAVAENWPERPITMVVGFAPGGATDILARLVSKGMSEALGQPIVVENRTGANSNIGADYVQRSKPDGYTLYVSSISNSINNTLYRDLRFDFIDNFAPVGLLATNANILVTNPDRPYRTVQELIDYARENPGEVTCASAGVGSSIHMSCELFKIQTDTDLLHIPYRGSSPAVADVVGGMVDVMFDNLPSAITYVRADKLAPIAVTTETRQESLPDTPTFVENGLEEFVVQAWFGINAPADTPQDRIDRLNEALNKTLQDPAILETYAQHGFLLPQPPNSPAEFGALIESEVKKWGDVVNTADIRVQ